jgi:Homeobox KN domain
MVRTSSTLVVTATSPTTTTTAIKSTSSLTLRSPQLRKKSSKLLFDSTSTTPTITATTSTTTTTNTNINTSSTTKLTPTKAATSIGFITSAPLGNSNHSINISSHLRQKSGGSDNMTDDDMYDDEYDGEDGDGNGDGDEDGMGDNVGSSSSMSLLNGKGRNKSRRELPNGAVETLKAWLLAPEHFTHPYPTPQDQVMLMQQTGIDKKQLKNWFTNARRRIWKPMLKKQIECGTIVPNMNMGGAYTAAAVATTTTSMGNAAAAGGMSSTAGTSNNTTTTPMTLHTNNPTIHIENNPHSVQAVRVHYQQALQDQNHQQQQQQQMIVRYEQTRMKVNRESTFSVSLAHLFLFFIIYS